ncbi:hypothetical protein AYO41_04510 [Verrucomicrobia bacterium SCGC AG-212-E04]|nr:hypothetical protein AYO41_04510 [Verrucomicrobia bacterium SCGC AG-212-E04]
MKGLSDLLLLGCMGFYMAALGVIRIAAALFPLRTYPFEFAYIVGCVLAGLATGFFVSCVMERRGSDGSVFAGIPVAAVAIYAFFWLPYALPYAGDYEGVPSWYLPLLRFPLVFCGVTLIAISFWRGFVRRREQRRDANPVAGV